MAVMEPKAVRMAKEALRNPLGAQEEIKPPVDGVVMKSASGMLDPITGCANRLSSIVKIRSAIDGLSKTKKMPRMTRLKDKLLEAEMYTLDALATALAVDVEESPTPEVQSE